MPSFLTAHLVVSGLPSSLVRPTRLSFDPGPKPWGEPGHRYEPSSLVRLLCRPHGGCQPVSRPVPWAYVLGLWAAFILGTICYPPSLCRSKLGQGLNHFLDRGTSSMLPDRVYWSRLVTVNCIMIIMASLDFCARSG